MNRDTKQREIATKYLENDKSATLDITMQFGKTLIAVMIMDALMSKGHSIQIVIPNLSAALTWKTHIKEYMLTHNTINTLTDIPIKTSHSILEGDATRTDYVIIDEIHLFLYGDRYKILNREYIKFGKILGLTGTVPTDFEHRGRLYHHTPILCSITEADALKQGWISKFVELNIELELSDNDKAKYVKYTDIIKIILDSFKGIYKFFTYPDGTKIFNNDLDLIYSIYRGKSTRIGRLTNAQIANNVSYRMGWDESKADNPYMQERAFWKPYNLRKASRQFYVAVNERNKVMFQNPIKLGAILRIVNKFGNIPTVCFTDSQKFAEIATDSVNNTFSDGRATFYHSGIKSRPMINPDTNDYYRYGQNAKKAGMPVMYGKTKILKDVIEGLTSGRYNFLSVVRAIDTSVTLKNTQLAIITSGSINTITHRQRTSRVKALDIYNPNKVVYIVNLFFGDFDWITYGEYNEIITTLHSCRDRVKLIERQQDSINIQWIKFEDFVKNS